MSILRPRILVIGLELEWIGAARLPRALQQAGFEVGVACRPNAFMASTCFRDHFFSLPEKNYGRAIFVRLKEIIRVWKPDFLLPTDDRTTVLLSRIHEIAARDKKLKSLAGLLARSLGNPLAVREAASKRRTIETARQLGIRVPATRTVKSVEELFEFGRRSGYPIIVKRAFGFAGRGVAICKSESEMFHALQSFRKPRTRLSLWLDRLRGVKFSPHWIPADDSIIVSKYVKGYCAMSLAAGFEGKMLGILTAIKEQSHPGELGPSSVVRFFQNAEMRAASEKLLGHWKLTGLIGFDFMIDADNRAWLIECNPRATPIAHLGAHVGKDLCFALYRQFVPGPPPTMVPIEELVVAHYPQEFWRDPDSPYLKSALYDVPKDDLSLLNRLQHANRRRKE